MTTYQFTISLRDALRVQEIVADLGYLGSRFEFTSTNVMQTTDEDACEDMELELEGRQIEFSTLEVF